MPLGKFVRLLKIIRQNGGPFKSLKKLFITDTLKDGRVVGTDSWGNTYYENYYYMIPRSRWVEYNPRFFLDYDASQVTPEWFGWLHHKTDWLPSEDCAKHCLNCCSYVQSWLQPHQENLTGTCCAYYPYSTTKPHIIPWNCTTIAQRIQEENDDDSLPPPKQPPLPPKLPPPPPCKKI